MNDDQHSRFLKRLDDSREAVFIVAEWLHKKGFTVKIPGISYAKVAADHMQHVDDGDLFIKRSKDQDWMRVEVKQMRFDFENKWPYPIFFVAGKKSIDRADPFPVAYVIVSKSLTHAGIVYGNTRHKWFEHKTIASNTGNVEMFYACENSNVKFVNLTEKIND